uniref:Uncharacterized protein n=1 Tax=Mycena chlorophos TaxID=658473 RepID=A0ABQ0L930_MYCCL|nr:predicted protein [Mycena chlorophos]
MADSEATEATREKGEECVYVEGHTGSLSSARIECDAVGGEDHDKDLAQVVDGIPGPFGHDKTERKREPRVDEEAVCRTKQEPI